MYTEVANQSWMYAVAGLILLCVLAQTLVFMRIFFFFFF